MFKNILELNGVKKLNNTQKKLIEGRGYLSGMTPGIDGDFYHECKPNNCNPSCDNASKGCM